MRVALAGLGGASVRGHLPAIARLESERRLTLVAAADPDAQRRALFSAESPGVTVFEDAESMLAAVPCDLLVVATQPSSHAELVSLGVDHGLHVICEKPLALTRSAHELVARACAEHPELALIPVHQYRYSPAWIAISRCARVAARLHVPFSVVVDVQRGADIHAASPWRSDIAMSGGMLADLGVHFLALGWTINEDLEVLASARSSTGAGRERTGALVRVGSGVLAIKVSGAECVRRTRVDLHIANGSVSWCDDTALVTVRGRVILRRQVDALVDRSHVDALYARLYRDLVDNLRRVSWRMHRTAEALTVGRVLVALLEQASANAVTSPNPATCEPSRPQLGHP